MSWFPPYRPSRIATVEISDLDGIALEWAVAAHEGLTDLCDYVTLRPKVRVHEAESDKGDDWWLMVWSGKTVEEWHPLTNWSQLGSLIDKYSLTFTTTTRDRPEQSFMSFCPPTSADREHGRGYGLTAKVAMLRAILQENNNHSVGVPEDLAIYSGCRFEREEDEDDIQNSDILVTEF